MIRFMNLNTAFLALTLVFAYGTYHVKYDAQRAVKQLKQIDQDLDAEKARERALEADWSLLNEPTRLQKLAAKHLALAPVEAKQVAAIGELKSRLQVLTASGEPETPADGRIVTAARLEPGTRTIVIRR
jgi:cell division protein FtsL